MTAAGSSPEAGQGTSAPETGPPPRAVLRFLSRLGHLLLATGAATGLVEATLQRVARAHRLRNLNVVALPTVLLVSFEDEHSTHLDVTAEQGLTLRFDQIEEVFALASDAERNAVTPAQGLARIAAILIRKASFGVVWRIAGHVLMTVGIACLLQPTFGVIGAAAFFGLVVGMLKAFAGDRGILTTLLPTVAAFVVALLALAAANHGFTASPIRVLVASLVTFLPGGLLATATIELAFGDVVSGASRFVTGMLQLVFLALGLVTAATLVGLPPADLMVAGSSTPLGAWAPWLGTLLFGIGHTLHYSARPGTLPWLLAVLMLATAMQQGGDAAFGGYMSGFLAALVITPAGFIVQYRLGGPPAMVTYLPSMWMLVPGSIGLIGVAELVSGNRQGGLDTFATTLFAIVAIALGVLIGAGAYNVIFDPIIRRVGTIAEAMQRRLPWRNGNVGASVQDRE